jgi:hypothetical protein
VFLGTRKIKPIKEVEMKKLITNLGMFLVVGLILIFAGCVETTMQQPSLTPGQQAVADEIVQKIQGVWSCKMTRKGNEYSIYNKFQGKNVNVVVWGNGMHSNYTREFVVDSAGNIKWNGDGGLAIFRLENGKLVGKTSDGTEYVLSKSPQK